MDSKRGCTAPRTAERTVSFERQTPGLYLPVERRQTLYEKAFLSPEREGDGEYSRNTTTWD